jgi:hypothetical protein
MHHERIPSDETMMATLKAKLDREQLEKLGPTGRFPEGKLTPNDEGEIAFAVGALKGKVVVNFGSPVASLGMSPDQARKLAGSLLEKANAIEPSKAKKRRGRRRD